MKTFIYNFPKLHHSSPNSFGANVHLRKILLKTVKVIERSRDVTPRSKVEESKGRPRSPCAPNMVQFQPLFPELRHFEKNGTRHFFRSAATLKVLVRPNWFEVKESRHANFGAIQAIFLQLSWSQHKLAHSCQGAHIRLHTHVCLLQSEKACIPNIMPNPQILFS